MSNLPFKFPVLWLPDATKGRNPNSALEALMSSTPFTSGSKKDIEKQSMVGDIIMDVDGRTWRLLKLVDLGFTRETMLQRIFAWIFGSHEIRYELSEQLSLPFLEIKELARAAILANPDAHQGEAVHEDGNLSDEQLATRIQNYADRVRKALSPLELIAMVDFNTYII